MIGVAGETRVDDDRRAFGKRGFEGRALPSIWRDNPVFVGDFDNSAQDIGELWSAASACGGGGGEFAEGTSGVVVVAWRGALERVRGSFGTYGSDGSYGIGRGRFLVRVPSKGLLSPVTMVS